MIRIIIYLMKLFIVLFCALFFSSCGFTMRTDGFFDNGITGSGNTKTESRTVTSPFEKIDVNQGIKVIVEQSDSTAITVEADDNIISHIITKIENGMLIIESDNSFSASSTPTVRVKMPIISGLYASSGSSIKSLNTLKTEDIKTTSSSGSSIEISVEADNIVAETSSGSSMQVSGKALKLSADSSSGSTLDAGSLSANDVTAKSSSGSSTDVNPILSLNAKASSGSSVNYKKTPKSLTKEESSGGSVSL